MDQILIDIKEEKEKIIEDLINKNICFSFLDIDSLELPTELNNYSVENEESLES
ncbi:hypothetical protein IKO50_06815 [bacterium]|jgi:hypothetical protein|nr:hypothetical protein [bacterium]